jgi:hypothetical protein
MLRGRWEVMEVLKQVEEPPGDSERTYARAVAREILSSVQGKAKPETTVGVAGAAYVLLTIEDKDRLVITPDDLGHAAETFAADIPDHSEPEIVMDARSWLSTLNLIEVNTVYCPEWQHFERIWTAPIYGEFDDITTHFDNPVALSLPAIETVLKEAFNDPTFVDADAFAGGARTLDDKELSAFLGHFRSELDDRWVPIANTDDQVWISPKRVHEQLSTEGERLGFGDVTSAISDVLSTSSSVNNDLLPDEIGSENIGPLMSVLQEEFGWRRIGMSTGIHWYNDWDTFIDDYSEHAESAQEILDNKADASIGELETAKIFFDHNRDALLELENTSSGQIDYVVRKLNSSINALYQESRLEDSTPGNTLSSAMETRTPTAYHVAKKFEERLEELRKEKEEGEDEAQGVRGVRY